MKITRRLGTTHPPVCTRVFWRLVPIAPMLGMSEETNAKVMTAALRLLHKLGRA